MSKMDILNCSSRFLIHFIGLLSLLNCCCLLSFSIQNIIKREIVFDRDNKKSVVIKVDLRPIFGFGDCAAEGLFNLYGVYLAGFLRS